jgi:hypothetical protein
MVIKEVRPIFLKVFSIVIVIILLNFVYMIYKNGGISQVTTGFSVKETIIGSYSSLSFQSKLFMISEWVFLFLLLIYAVYWDKRMLIKKNDLIDLHIQRNVDKNKTDLDTLYEIIKEKKELPISTISKSFNITKDIAMEWCKILESGELVSLSYPGFSEPLVRINEKRPNNVEIEAHNTAKDQSRTKKDIIESQGRKKESEEEIINQSVPNEEINEEVDENETEKTNL